MIVMIVGGFNTSLSIMDRKGKYTMNKKTEGLKSTINQLDLTDVSPNNSRIHILK